MSNQKPNKTMGNHFVDKISGLIRLDESNAYLRKHPALSYVIAMVIVFAMSWIVFKK